MLAYNYNQKGEYLGSEEVQPNPLEPGKWLFPANATLAEPPEFDPVRQSCCFDGEKWVTEDFPEEEPEPALSEEEKRQRQCAEIRFKHDMLLLSTDKVMLEDYPVTVEEREQYLRYRQYLRDIPKAEEFPELEVKTFEEWKGA